MMESDKPEAVWDEAIPKLNEAQSTPNAEASERSAMEDDIVRRALAMGETRPAGYGSDASGPARLQATNPNPSGE